MAPLPTPHLDKIRAALDNDKMPPSSVKALRKSLAEYKKWVDALSQVVGTEDEIVAQMVRLLNEYKYHIDFNLIFESKEDFLYRQKGQLKLDNSIIEEFLPHLVSRVFPQLEDGITLGPAKCFSAAYFKGSLQSDTAGGGLDLRTKDQDFAIAKKVFIKSSHDSNFDKSESVETCLGYVTTECKTNLDKTMFQEATATAHDVKSALPGAKYFLLCDWLDMTPISTAPTDIDEVLITRKSRRIASNVRDAFNSYEGRMSKADWYSDFLQSNPFSVEVFQRFVGHIESLMTDEDPAENTVLADGYF